MRWIKAKGWGVRHWNRLGEPQSDSFSLHYSDYSDDFPSVKVDIMKRLVSTLCSLTMTTLLRDLIFGLVSVNLTF